LLGHLVTARASDSMFLFIDFVRVTNCFYDYDYRVYVISFQCILFSRFSTFIYLFNMNSYT